MNARFFFIFVVSKNRVQVTYYFTNGWGEKSADKRIVKYNMQSMFCSKPSVARIYSQFLYNNAKTNQIPTIHVFYFY